VVEVAESTRIGRPFAVVLADSRGRAAAVVLEQIQVMAQVSLVASRDKETAAARDIHSEAMLREAATHVQTILF
jgi:hypothetical protein